MARILFFRVPEKFKAPPPAGNQKRGKLLLFRRPASGSWFRVLPQRLRGVRAE